MVFIGISRSGREQRGILICLPAPGSQECAKLDPEFEQSLAEKAFTSELEEWPEY